MRIESHESTLISVIVLIALSCYQTYDSGLHSSLRRHRKYIPELQLCSWRIVYVFHYNESALFIRCLTRQCTSWRDGFIGTSGWSRSYQLPIALRGLECAFVNRQCRVILAAVVHVHNKYPACPEVVLRRAAVNPGGCGPRETCMRIKKRRHNERPTDRRI